MGWKSVVEPMDFERIHLEPFPNAWRLEEGSPNMTEIIGLGASLSLIEEIGIEAIESRILELIARLQERGYEVTSSLEPEERSGIVTFRHPGHPSGELVKYLTDRKEACALRGGCVRFSLHFSTMMNRDSNPSPQGEPTPPATLPSIRIGKAFVRLRRPSGRHAKLP